MMLLTKNARVAPWRVCFLSLNLVLATALFCLWGQKGEAYQSQTQYRQPVYEHTGQAQVPFQAPDVHRADFHNQAELQGADRHGFLAENQGGTSTEVIGRGYVPPHHYQTGRAEGAGQFRQIGQTGQSDQISQIDQARGREHAGQRGQHDATTPYGAADQVPWRIRFVEAAVIEGDVVTLGEVAVPAGDIPRQEWEKLASRPLWPAPPDNGRAVNMTRPKLQEAVMATMRDLAPYCLFPSSLALQRGGAVMHEPAIQALAVKELTPLAAGIEAETHFKDFRLPSHIFLEHPGQIVGIEPQKKMAPGRVNFRVIVKEVDGSVSQRIAGSVFMDAWKEVPSATVTLNKNDVLEASQVGRIRVNLAHLRGTPWDGRGGPWRMVRAVGVEQVIYQNDLAHIPTVPKGAVVNLVYEAKTVRLQVQAEALSDGVVGENIRVKNLQSKKEVYGVVRDAGTVVIRGNFQ